MGWLRSENSISDTMIAQKHRDPYGDFLRIVCGGSLGSGCH